MLKGFFSAFEIKKYTFSEKILHILEHALDQSVPDIKVIQVDEIVILKNDKFEYSFPLSEKNRIRKVFKKIVKEEKLCK